MVESSTFRNLDRFIIAQNIERYQNLLSVTTDENERQRILALICEEEAKKASLEKPL